ncbi:MAG: TetR/AcrR family transcriptional regulator [Myxococcales bacterium]|nr:TetR/AcrR family transcriptional regulator [Myxococcales bacterium]
MRDGLVDGCVRLFADRGYASLTMREVAAALGVSTGTLYHYFPGKDALFDAVVRAVAAQDLGAVADYADLPADPGLRLAALLAHVEVHEDRFARELLVLLEVRRIHGEHEGPLAGVRAAADAYVAAIDGFLGTRDPELARLLLVAINGLLIQRLIDHRRTPLAGQLPRLLRLLPAPASPA